MTTARALLRRLLARGRIDPAAPGKVGAEAGAGSEEAVGERLEAARERLKRTIPPPEPEEGSSPVSNDPPPNLN